MVLMNPNQTWTAKIFWTGAKPEPEPLFETVRHPVLNTIDPYCFNARWLETLILLDFCGLFFPAHSQPWIILLFTVLKPFLVKNQYGILA